MEFFFYVAVLKFSVHQQTIVFNVANILYRFAICSYFRQRLFAKIRSFIKTQNSFFDCFHKGKKSLTYAYTTAIRIQKLQCHIILTQSTF